jgi:integrase/recombinase XerD
MKHNREGKATVITNDDYLKIRSCLTHPYQCIWDIAWYTGERWGAILQLKKENVYEHNNKPMTEITFSSSTRKKVSGSQSQTRQVYIHPALKESLKAYLIPQSSLMFPSKKNPEIPISMRLADFHLREVLRRLKWQNRGISTHSTRRSFITSLAHSNIPITEIQAITGHSSIEVVAGYIASDPATQKKAILTLR